MKLKTPFPRPLPLFAWALLGATGASLFAAHSAFAADDKNSNAPTGITKPSKELKLAFEGPGVVRDVPVQEGDHVTAGQVLAMQDQRQDQATYDSMKLEADSTAKIDYSTVDRDEKDVQYKRQQKMLEQRVTSDSDVEQAKLAVNLSNTQIDLAKLEHAQKGLEATKQEIKLKQMEIVSPIDGIVEKLNIGQGEMADPQNREGAIVVVRNDPLWVEVHLPTSQALQLQPGQVLPVKYQGEKDWQDAKIIFFSPQADASSDTELVRLEMRNPNNRASGLQVQVKLPDKIAAVADGSNPSDAVNP